MSYKYYDDHAQEFYESTINADMSELIRKFTSYLKPGAHILDAGSGVGRDTKTFLEMGYKVTAFDASQEMVKISTEYTGVKTRLLRFEEMDYINEFDAIWACASLLHVNSLDLVDVFTRLGASMKDDGVMFISFKYGTESYIKENRTFTCMTPELIKEILDEISIFTILSTFVSSDVRGNRKNEMWTNAFIQKIRLVE